jgi:hypothetical protein
VPIGYSASSTSSDKREKQVKRPNPSFKGRRQENSTRQGERMSVQGLSQMENSRCRNTQRGLNVEEWQLREQQRGYTSSPNMSEFSDLNDLVSAKNIHHE